MKSKHLEVFKHWYLIVISIVLFFPAVIVSMVMASLISLTGMDIITVYILSSFMCGTIASIPIIIRGYTLIRTNRSTWEKAILMDIVSICIYSVIGFVVFNL